MRRAIRYGAMAFAAVAVLGAGAALPAAHPAAGKGAVAAGLRELTERLCGPPVGGTRGATGIWQKLLKKT